MRAQRRMMSRVLLGQFRILLPCEIFDPAQRRYCIYANIPTESDIYANIPTELMIRLPKMYKKPQNLVYRSKMLAVTQVFLCDS